MSPAPEPLRVFVDGHAVDVTPMATALDAVSAWDPAMAADVVAKARVITDSRGLPIASDTVMVAGSILRVIAHRVRNDPGLPDDLP